MENTSKNFALQLGSLISLYISIGALIALLLSIITIMFPDQAQDPYERTSAGMGIRTAIAMLVVFYPTYVVLTRMVNNIRRREQGTYLVLTKWLIYLSLLVGGGVLLGDLVSVLNSFLNGELTIRFALKALSVLVVVAAAFAYYLADVRGYWQTHEAQSIRYAGAVSIFVAIAVLFGVTRIESPSEVRAMRLDQTQVRDLQLIQDNIQSYAMINNELPQTLEEAFNGLSVPRAPEGRDAYSYHLITSTKFTLCAEFAYPTPESERTMYADSFLKEPFTIRNSNNWSHGRGDWCYERVLNVR